MHHSQEGWIFWSIPRDMINDERMSIVRTPPKLGTYWEINPLTSCHGWLAKTVSGRVTCPSSSLFSLFWAQLYSGNLSAVGDGFPHTYTFSLLSWLTSWHLARSRTWLRRWTGTRTGRSATASSGWRSSTSWNGCSHIVIAQVMMGGFPLIIPTEPVLFSFINLVPVQCLMFHWLGCQAKAGRENCPAKIIQFNYLIVRFNLLYFHLIWPYYQI